jgi:hypothetical protein
MGLLKAGFNIGKGLVVGHIKDKIKDTVSNKVENVAFGQMTKDMSDSSVELLQQKAHKLQASGNSFGKIRGYYMDKAATREKYKRLRKELGKDEFKRRGLAYQEKQDKQRLKGARSEARSLTAIWKNGIQSVFTLLGATFRAANTDKRPKLTNSKIELNTQLEVKSAEAKAQAQQARDVAASIKIPAQASNDNLREVYARSKPVEQKLDTIIDQLNTLNKEQNDTRKNSLELVKINKADFEAKANRQDQLLNSLQRMQSKVDSTVQRSEDSIKRVKTAKISPLEIVSQVGIGGVLNIFKLLKTIIGDLNAAKAPELTGEVETKKATLDAISDLKKDLKSIQKEEGSEGQVQVIQQQMADLNKSLLLDQKKFKELTTRQLLTAVSTVKESDLSRAENTEMLRVLAQKQEELSETDKQLLKARIEEQKQKLLDKQKDLVKKKYEDQIKKLELKLADTEFKGKKRTKLENRQAKLKAKIEDAKLTKEAKKQLEGSRFNLIKRLKDRKEKKQEGTLKELLSVTKKIHSDQKKNFWGIFKKIATFGGIAAIIYGIVKGGQGVTRWINEHLFKPVKDWWNEEGGIGESLKNWWEGPDGKSGASAKITSFFTNLWTQTTEAIPLLKNISEIISKFWKKYSGEDVRDQLAKSTGLDTVIDTKKYNADELQQLNKVISDGKFTEDSLKQLESDSSTKDLAAKIKSNGDYTKLVTADEIGNSFVRKVGVSNELGSASTTKTMISDAASTKTGKAVTTVASVGGMAAAGGAIGSVIPGVGTAIGAGIGAALGLVVSDYLKTQAHLNSSDVLSKTDEIKNGLLSKLKDIDSDHDGKISIKEYESGKGILTNDDKFFLKELFKTQEGKNLLESQVSTKLNQEIAGYYPQYKLEGMGTLTKMGVQQAQRDVDYMNLATDKNLPWYRRLMYSMAGSHAGRWNGGITLPGETTWLGDAGKSELAVTPKGDIIVSPPTTTKYDFPAGTKIYPDANAILAKVPKVVPDPIQYLKENPNLLKDGNPRLLETGKEDRDSSWWPKKTQDQAIKQSDGITDDLAARQAYLMRWTQENMGLTPEQSAGVAGVFTAESRVKPNIYGGIEKYSEKEHPDILKYRAKGIKYLPNGYGAGLAQWTNTDDFKHYGKPGFNDTFGWKTDILNSINANRVATGRPKVTAVENSSMDDQLVAFKDSIETGRKKGFLEKLKAARTVEDATDVMLRGYENGGRGSLASKEAIDKYTWAGGYAGSMKSRVGHAKAALANWKRFEGMPINIEEHLGDMSDGMGKGRKDRGSYKAEDAGEWYQNMGGKISNTITDIVGNIKDWITGKSAIAGEALYGSANSDDGLLKKLNVFWGKHVGKYVEGRDKRVKVDEFGNEIQPKSKETQKPTQIATQSTYTPEGSPDFIGSRQQLFQPVKSPLIQAKVEATHSPGLAGIKSPILTPDTEAGPQQSALAKQLEIMNNIDRQLNDQPWNMSRDNGTSIGQIRGGDTNTTIINNNMVIDDAKTVEMRNNQ